VPRVTPRESMLVGAAGIDEVKELTVICGRPPAKASVVRMRSVRAPIWDEEAVHLMVVGLLTALNWAIGKEPTEEEPIVNVTGPHELMRESELREVEQRI